MLRAGREAGRRGIPIVLDPVGCGATRFRTDASRLLLAELSPAIVRGNASEIASLAGVGAVTKGGDSTLATDEMIESVQLFSEKWHCLVSVSGATDLIVGGGVVLRVRNGHGAYGHRGRDRCGAVERPGEPPDALPRCAPRYRGIRYPEASEDGGGGDLKWALGFELAFAASRDCSTPSARSLRRVSGVRRALASVRGPAMVPTFREATPPSHPGGLTPGIGARQVEPLFRPDMAALPPGRAWPHGRV